MNRLNYKTRLAEIEKSIKIESDKKVYPPDEDTFLLLTYSFPVIQGKVLELGAGSGYISLILKKAGFDIDASDISKDSINTINKNSKLNNLNFPVIHSDLFEKISKKYDTIIFNPPYLPEEELFEYKGKDVNGGKEGLETIIRSLGSIDKFLNKKGKFIFIFSTLGNMKQLEEHLNRKFSNKKFNWTILHTENVGMFDKLKIYQIEKLH